MTLETERLFIRSTELVAPEAVAAYQARNRTFMKPYEPARDAEFYTTAFWERTLRADLEDEQNDRAYHFYIFPREAPERLIGFLGLTGVTRGDFQSCWLGYQLDERHINRGYMTEAINAVAAYAFGTLGLHRIEANIMPRNERSLRVAEKCGFAREGLSKQYLRIRGVWEDHVRLAKRNENA